MLRNARFVCELACGNNLICKENQIKYICFIILRECTALVVDRNAKRTVIHVRTCSEAADVVTHINSFEIINKIT